MVKQKKSIIVQGGEISILSINGQDNYISLTDIMKNFEDEYSIYSWMRNSNTVEFLGVWEQLHNPNFKPNEFVTFKNHQFPYFYEKYDNSTMEYCKLVPDTIGLDGE